MNVFEDLIVELKEENLLEDTVIAVDSTGSSDEFSGEFAKNSIEDEDSTGRHNGFKGDPEKAKSNLEVNGGKTGSDDVRKTVTVNSQQKFGSDQVSACQIVEHIISAIERSRLKIEPKAYDELNAKKALHRCTQVSADPSSLEFAEAQAELAAELSAWQNVLEARDKEISGAMVRRYCETCQPALSPQALFALARFYRGLPYSQTSRSKFDFIVTRLFSKTAEGERRQLICSKEEMLGHLRSRFKQLADVAMNLVSSDDSDRLLAVLTCDDFVAEAENAETFEELIGSDFFKRIRQFKDSSGPLFFVSEVAAAAIDCNVRIGNRLVDLIDEERGTDRAVLLRERFNSIDEETISDAAGRTLVLEELLKKSPDTEKPARKRSEDKIDAELVEHRIEEPTADDAEDKAEKRWLQFRLAGVNKWLLMATILTVVFSVGLYVWANYYAAETPVSSNVRAVDLENSWINEFVKEGRISGETFYGITQPEWDTFSKDKKHGVLEKILKSGDEKGFKRVSLINAKGQTVGFASATRVEVLNP